MFGNTDVENAQIASEIESLVQAFAPQLGAKQERVIRDANQALQSPDFQSLAEQLEQRGEEGYLLARRDSSGELMVSLRSEEDLSDIQWGMVSQYSGPGGPM